MFRRQPDHELSAKLDEYFKSDNWPLACATWAYDKSNGMWFGFDGWWDVCKDKWMASVRDEVPECTEPQLRNYLLNYAKAHTRRIHIVDHKLVCR